MLIRSVSIVCLLSLTYPDVESVHRGDVPNKWKDRPGHFATKDDIRDVLKRMKIQEQKISNLEKEVKIRDEALDGRVSFAIKDDIKDVLERTEIQEQRISNLEKDVEMRDEALIHQSAVVMKLEKIVQQQSQNISKLELDARGINVKLETTMRSLVEKCNINCCKFDGTVSNNSNAYSNSKEIKATLPMKRDEAENKDNLPIKPEEAQNKEENSSQMAKTRLQSRHIRRDYFPKRTASADVSFSVYLSQPQEHLGAKEVVKFDRVITNDGNAYNSQTGVFTVPVTGTYFFIFYVSSSSSNILFHLVVDDSLKTSGVARPYASGQGKEVQGGGAVILKLNQGVSVWIENQGSDRTVYSTDVYRLVTFSGFLLY